MEKEERAIYSWCFLKRTTNKMANTSLKSDFGKMNSNSDIPYDSLNC